MAKLLTDLLMALGQITDLALSYVSATTVQVGIGATRDKDDSWCINLAAAKNADITVSGKGGLDTGSEAGDTWYAVHVIGDTDEVNSPDTLLSLSRTAPTLPEGYNVFRFVGWVRNDGSSNFVPFHQIGMGKERAHYIDAARAGFNPLTDGGSQSMATVALASYIPPTAMEVILDAEFEPASNGDYAALSHGDSTVATADQITRIGPGVGANNIYANLGIRIPVNSSQEIKYGQSAAQNDLTLFVRGYCYSV